MIGEIIRTLAERIQRLPCGYKQAVMDLIETGPESNKDAVEAARRRLDSLVSEPDQSPALRSRASTMI